MADVSTWTRRIDCSDRGCHANNSHDHIHHRDPIRPRRPTSARPTVSRAAIRRKSFGVLSTVSASGWPHAAGVLYDAVAGEDGIQLYVNTFRSSRKARNVAADGHVAFVIPVRRLPIGPPFSIQFQATARIVEMNDPTITDLVATRCAEALRSARHTRRAGRLLHPHRARRSRPHLRHRCLDDRRRPRSAARRRTIGGTHSLTVITTLPVFCAEST